jgi:RNA polymerase sigma factor (sigma-70 family)
MNWHTIRCIEATQTFATMQRRPILISRARQAGALNWPLIQRALASEARYQVLRPYLVETLAKTDLPFLPDLAEPGFHERNEKARAQTSGDPLSIYWADLQRLKPTNRTEEFLLARSIDLLRATLIAILGKRPPALARALTEEYLSPYSPVLEQMRELPTSTRNMATDRLDRLRQRIKEITLIQTSLVHRNLHAVPATARRYRHVGVPWEDLIQEGNTALLRAVERYSRHEGVRFASYAGWWIQQGILKALSFQSRTVRLPVYLAQALHRVRDAQATEPGSINSTDLADRTGLTLERVERALKADRQCLSINRTANREDDGCLADVLPDPRNPALPDQPTLKSLRGSLDTLLGTLPPREALVLRLRFGLEDGHAWTLEEVRQRLGISRERVRQLQSQSLGRLTRPTPLKQLARYI